MSLPYFISWTKQSGATTFDIEGAENGFYYDSNGKRYFDLSSTSYQAGFGHKDQDIISAIKKQLDHLPISSPKAIFELKESASKKLLKALDLNMGKIFYTTSGAESIENALKMARHYTKKQIILARNNCYHGATLGALSVTGDWRNHGHKTVDEWTVRIPEPADDPNCEETRKIILETGPENIAAFCLETITGGNGVILPPNSWWPSIQKLCKEFGILLIVDEVVCGFGRTGTKFGYQNFNIKPDFVCMAKMITGGYIPFGAVWVHPNVSSYYNDETLSCGTTNFGHPLGLAAMDAVLTKIDSKSFKENFGELESQLDKGLSEIEKLKNIKEVRRIGLLAAIDLADIDLTLSDLLEENIYIVMANNRLILAPQFCLNSQELQRAMDHLIDVLKEKSNE